MGSPEVGVGKLGSFKHDSGGPSEPERGPTEVRIFQSTPPDRPRRETRLEIGAGQVGAREAGLFEVDGLKVRLSQAGSPKVGGAGD